MQDEHDFYPDVREMIIVPSQRRVRALVLVCGEINIE